MSAHKYKCINLADCDKALHGETIEITIEIKDGEEPKCPDCKRKLVPDTTKDGPDKWLLITVAAFALVSLGAGAYLWRSGKMPTLWRGMQGQKPPAGTGGAPAPAAGASPGPAPAISPGSAAGTSSPPVTAPPAEPAARVYACGLKPTQSADVARLLQYLKQGMNYAAQKKPELALTEFHQVLKIDPNFLGAAMNIGSAHLARKQYPEAEAAFGRELKLIGCLKQMSDNDLADFAYMEEAGAQPPDQKKKTQAALFRPHLDKAEAEAHYNLACLNSRRSQRDTALSELKKALAGGLIAKKSLQTDPDLQSIRRTAEFKSLMDSYIPDTGSNL